MTLSLKRAVLKVAIHNKNGKGLLLNCQKKSAKNYLGRNPQ